MPMGAHRGTEPKGVGTLRRRPPAQIVIENRMTANEKVVHRLKEQLRLEVLERFAQLKTSDLDQ